MKTKSKIKSGCAQKQTGTRTESKSVFTPAVAELVAIGAAIAANCEPCFKYHFNQAKKHGVSNKDMARAVAMAQAVKEAPARNVLELANKILGVTASNEEAGVPPKGACANSKKTSGGCCAK